MQQTHHNSELCCVTCNEWVCEREGEIAFPSQTYTPSDPDWRRICFAEGLLQGIFHMYFIMLKLIVVTSCTLSNWFFQNYAVYILFRKSDVILSFSDKQSHSVTECMNLAVICPIPASFRPLALLMIAYMFRTNVFILTKLVASGFHQGNKFSMLLVIWFRKYRQGPRHKSVEHVVPIIPLKRRHGLFSIRNGAYSK